MPSHLKKLVHARMEKTGESYQTALRHVRGDGGTAPEPRNRVWSHDLTFFLADSVDIAKRDKALLVQQWGQRFPWLLREDKEWFEIEGHRELRLDNGKQTTTRTAEEWAARLPAGFMAVIDMNTGTLHGAHWLEETWKKVERVTYYAVVHGGRGSENFRPMRTPPGVSRLVFEYEAPAFQNDADLRADFDIRFLPLKVSFFDSDGRHGLSDDYSFRSDTAFEEARMFAGSLLRQRARWVVIATKDDQIISILPNAPTVSPMPFLVAEHWARQGAIIGRMSWPTGRFLPSHATRKGSYTMRLEDGRMETWTPSEEDKAANDWTGLGPVAQ